MWFYRNNSDKFEGCTLWWSKEITGKWEYSLGFWQLYTNCPQQKNLMKSPDERLFRQEVAEDWRVSFSSDEEEASWFHFLFSFCFDILASCLRIQQYSFLWRPPLRSFSPPHHTLLIIIIVVGYRVWQTSKGRLWSLERLASRGHHGGPRRTLHSTGQLSSVSGGAETGRSQEIADDIGCVLLNSPHSTLGLVLVDGGGIYTRGLILIWVLALFSYLL